VDQDPEAAESLLVIGTDLLIADPGAVGYQEDQVIIHVSPS
jgi:hypothetical protein